MKTSTMKSRISNSLTLSASEQDRIYRANRVCLRALEVLEDEDAARAWIRRSNRTLGRPTALIHQASASFAACSGVKPS
ncbi:hypothetical protein [Duganella violaceipulchra]|uniref:Uncharacterized protein (DUF2384 family) n=1 Tax=Duganella violaceipulchra TaxID=2849652 RepID=A0AA41HGL5_9BURK|nr:hypothetical protein [Duganella violaceicalia]MBV6324737.1 hypothetical protein [Duganella violaceicalia]MCP2009060.1 uncharacterized protein (DUF2384 family) [Duganella violaceicalia]